MVNMRIALAILLAVVVLASFTSPLQAEENARYSFASAQGEKEIRVAPGGEGKGVIYFYNIDGNRITHISLSVNHPPDGWKVDIQPPSHELEVQVNDIPVTIAENLHVEPATSLSEEPRTVPDGMACVQIPTRGYVLAVPAHITIGIPESAKLGTEMDITISAEAQWLGQTGSAAMKQERDFQFTVVVAPETSSYPEKVIEDKNNPLTLLQWLMVTIVAAVILGSFLSSTLIRRRRR